jgi:hypothetical protein
VYELLQGSDEQKAIRAIGYLVERKFQELWRGREWGQFTRFVLLQGVPARAFLITFPVGDKESGETGYAWFHYEVLFDPSAPEKEAVKLKHPSVAISKPESGRMRDCPDEWKGLPVWRYNP